VTAHGTLIFPLSFVYDPDGNPNTTRTIVMPFTVQFTDDRGNHLTVVVQWATN
jgi:hypothetical protein